jgi:hypothetical protein
MHITTNMHEHHVVGGNAIKVLTRCNAQTCAIALLTVEITILASHLCVVSPSSCTLLPLPVTILVEHTG